MAVLDVAHAMRCATSLVMFFEDGGTFQSRPYQDQGGVWTIGSGLTRIDGRAVGPATPAISPSLDEIVVQRDITRWLTLVERLVQVDLLAQQAAALVSLVFNCGEAPLLANANIGRALKCGEYGAAADGFRVWNHVDGAVVLGLTIRREMERQVFLGVLDPLDHEALLSAQQKCHSAFAFQNDVARAGRVAPAESAGDRTADDLMNIFNPGV